MRIFCDIIISTVKEVFTINLTISMHTKSNLTAHPIAIYPGVAAEGVSGAAAPFARYAKEL